MVDLGTSHHVTMDIANLALYEPYTAFYNVIIGDGTYLSITNIGSFIIISLFTPLFFTDVLHVQDRHTGATLVCGEHRNSVYY